jgi:predicted transposase YbfD/YdcC
MQLTKVSLFHSWLHTFKHFTLLYPTKHGYIRIQVQMNRMSGMDIQYTNLLASSLGTEIHVNHRHCYCVRSVSQHCNADTSSNWMWSSALHSYTQLNTVPSTQNWRKSSSCVANKHHHISDASFTFGEYLHQLYIEYWMRFFVVFLSPWG